jgi:hypothetical protein
VAHIVAEPRGHWEITFPLMPYARTSDSSARGARTAALSGLRVGRPGDIGKRGKGA